MAKSSTAYLSKGEVKLWEHIAKWKYAAILAFFLTAGLAFYIGYNKEKQVVVAQQTNQRYKDDVLPGGDKAMLLLADDSVVVLENVNNESLTQQVGTQIVYSMFFLSFKKFWFRFIKVEIGC